MLHWMDLMEDNMYTAQQSTGWVKGSFNNKQDREENPCFLTVLLLNFQSISQDHRKGPQFQGEKFKEERESLSFVLKWAWIFMQGSC